ncbi:MAG TPA: type II secretion system protein [bacterium]|nr:type II secretion system protein [bacterium]
MLRAIPPARHHAPAPRRGRRAWGPARGYNLIEILAVASIMLILAGVALASLKEARLQAQESTAVGALNQMQNAYEQYRVTKGRRNYPHFLSTGLTNSSTIPYRNAQELFADLVREGFLPRRYSGRTYNEPHLLAAGYRMEIFPFDRPGVDTRTADVSENYAIAFQPIPGSKQRFTLALINGQADNTTYAARFYKLPDKSLDLSRASVYMFAERK